MLCNPLIFFSKNWPNPASFVYFRPLLITISVIQIEKSIDGVLGIQSRSCRMVGADYTTELAAVLTLLSFARKSFRLLLCKKNLFLNYRFNSKKTIIDTCTGVNVISKL